MSNQASGDAGIYMSKWAAGIVLGLLVTALGWAWTLSARLTSMEKDITAIRAQSDNDHAYYTQIKGWQDNYDGTQKALDKFQQMMKEKKK
jgi:hypothetical protein